MPPPNNILDANIDAEYASQLRRSILLQNEWAK